MEPILEPDLRLCDAHHHLMDAYGYHYLRDDLLSDIGSGHNVTSTVYVECTTGYRTNGPEHLRPVGESEFVVRQQVPEGIMGAVVAFADPRLGLRVEEVLDAHYEVLGDRLAGIRFMAAWDATEPLNRVPTKPGPAVLWGDAFRQGVAAIGRRGLVFDCWVFFHQLLEVEALAQALPNQVLVVNHIGGPLFAGPYAGHRSDVEAVWRDGLNRLSACPNVNLKIGGLNMHELDAPWLSRPQAVTSEEFAGYWKADVRYAIDLFGPSRCMFESNFPVDREGIDYRTLWNGFKLMTSSYNPGEHAALLHDTAARIYRLKL